MDELEDEWPAGDDVFPMRETSQEPEVSSENSKTMDGQLMF